VYKLLRNRVYIRKALEKYESNILKIISQISLYSKKEFLTQVSKAINFVRREREISRKVFDKMRIIQFRLKLIGIIISLSLSVSCHILKVFEEEYYNIFSETVFWKYYIFQPLFFSSIFFSNHFSV